MATTVNPDTGASDADTLGTLNTKYGHQDFGVFGHRYKIRRRKTRRQGGIDLMEMQYTIADDATREEAELGRLLFAQETDFLKGVVAMDGMPPADRMEICFAGSFKRRQIQPDQRPYGSQITGTHIQHTGGGHRKSTSSPYPTATIWSMFRATASPTPPCPSSKNGKHCSRHTCQAVHRYAACSC